MAGDRLAMRSRGAGGLAVQVELVTEPEGTGNRRRLYESGEIIKHKQFLVRNESSD